MLRAKKHQKKYRPERRFINMSDPNTGLNVGDKAPRFVLPDQDGKEVSLDDFSGRWVALYFYPKDSTPGCTTEARDFTDAAGDFDKLNAVILGVSPDTAQKHRNFIDKQSLKIRLLSDTEHKALEGYGVWQLKKMYGREYMGIVRSTFLIDPKGKITDIWRKVKVKGHVDEVMERLEGR